MAIGFMTWAERWFPDAFIFVAIAVVVSLAAPANGAAPPVISRAFGDGFWSLVPFTMLMVFVVIGGYVVASSAPAQELIRSFATIPERPAPVRFGYWPIRLNIIRQWRLARALNARLGGRATPGIRPSRNRRAMKAVAAGSNRDIGASTALRDALIGETCANPRRELLASLQTR